MSHKSCDCCKKESETFSDIVELHLARLLRVKLCNSCSNNFTYWSLHNPIGRRLDYLELQLTNFSAGNISIKPILGNLVDEFANLRIKFIDEIYQCLHNGSFSVDKSGQQYLSIIPDKV